MKKIVVVLICVLALTGCGKKETKKVCSVEEQGIKLSMIATAKSSTSNVDKFSVEYSVTYKTAGIDKDSLTDETKAAFEEQAKIMFASFTKDEEKIKVDFQDEKLLVTTTMTPDEWAESLGEEKEDLDIRDFVKYMEDLDYTCK